MADRPFEYIGPIIKAMESLKYDLGSDIMSGNRELYCAVLELVALHAMTLKIIQDLHPGVVTDEVLGQRLATAVDTGPDGDRSGWPGWLVLGVSPSLLPQYGATESDSVPVLQQKIYDYNHPA